MPNTSSPFTGIEGVDSSGAGAYIKPGKHLLEVGKTFFKQGFKGPVFIAECDVIESNVHPVGQRVSFVAKLNPADKVRNDLGLGNIKGFVAAALAEDEKKIGEIHVNAVVDGTNRLAGTRLKCIAVEVPTQKVGGVFTKCNWEYASGGLVEAQRAAAKPAG